MTMPSYFHGLSELAVTAGGRRGLLPCEMPFTGAVISEIPACTEADVDLAVSRARRYLPVWKATSVRVKTRLALRLHDLILSRQQELMDLIQIDTGKARRDALEEVFDAANTIRYYARRAELWLADDRLRGVLPLLTKVTRRQVPHGVVGLITPWNYPFTLALSDAIPALLSGNVVILKPAEEASLTGLRAALLVREAGFPRDAFQVVTGRGDEAGRALVDRADAVCFTGSTDVGVDIATRSAKRLIPFSLELGGKNPMIVLDDAPLERAVDGAVRGAFSNAGQLCIAAERLYVEESIFDRFLERFIGRTKGLVLGSDYSFGADVGSLISNEQLAKTVAHVEDALSGGAKIEAGGRRRTDLGPYFYEPTILTEVSSRARMYSEETFGPVVALYRFSSDDEAVKLANESPYGLNASVWSTDTARAREMASALTCGTVNVNDAYAASWGSVAAPMGGMKLSGFGRRHGSEGFFRFLEPQTIAVQHGTSAGSRFGPAAEMYRRSMTGALRVLRRVPGIG